MKIAYLILSHGHFEHLIRIVNSLISADVTFFIHIDRQADVNYVELKKRFSENSDVHLVPERLYINWGGYSMVEGILYLLRTAIEHRQFDYLSLISGQDFPLRSSKSIRSFLKEHAGNEFIEYFTLPVFTRLWGAKGGLERYIYYWLVDELGMDRAQAFVKTQSMEGCNRAFPNGWQPYGGSMWFTLTYACAKYICTFLDQHDETVRFFRHTCIPDEMLIPTLVLNSPFKNAVVNNNLRYIDWRDGGPHPKVLTMSDLDELKKSDRHFARKFDYKVDRQIVQVLEEVLE